MQEKVFLKLFKAAEIAKFTRKERDNYEKSLKYYRDLQNVVDTSRKEGMKKGMKKGKKKREKEIAIEMKKAGEPLEKIMKYTGLSKEEIEKL